MYYSVTKVQPLADYQLQLTFENNEIKVFDVKPYLELGVFKALKDPNIFQQVKVVFDTIEWPGGIDLDPEELYEDGKPAATWGVAEERAVYKTEPLRKNSGLPFNKEPMATTISTFHGIAFKMTLKDLETYPAPHIHAEYGDMAAVYDIESAEMLAGELPPDPKILVEGWIVLNRENLMANWSLAEADSPLCEIRGV